jgi:hypothetical protein
MSRLPDRTREEGEPTGPDPTTHSLAGPRAPEYLIVLWVSQQLREQIRRNNAALAREFQDHGQLRHRRTAGPTAELEAES